MADPHSRSAAWVPSTSAVQRTSLAEHSYPSCRWPPEIALHYFQPAAGSPRGASAGTLVRPFACPMVDPLCQVFTHSYLQTGPTARGLRDLNSPLLHPTMLPPPRTSAAATTTPAQRSLSLPSAARIHASGPPPRHSCPAALSAPGVSLVPTTQTHPRPRPSQSLASLNFS